MNTRRFMNHSALWLAALLVAASVFAADPAQAGKFRSPGSRVDPRSPAARMRASAVKPRRPPVVSMDEALKLVRSGDRVLLPTEAGVSQPLLDGLQRRALTLKGKKPVEVLHTASLAKYAPDAMSRPDRFRVNALFVNSGARSYVDKLKITPTHLSEIPKLLDNNLKPNVVLIKVSPPDKRGYVNTGVSAGLISDFVADRKVKVIAAVSKDVPKTRGASRLHVSHIDKMVVTDEPMNELSWGPSSLVDMAIGRNVAELIPNGSTLQLGIGPLQAQVAKQLSKKGKRVNDKGGQFKVRVRTEMIDDGLVDMAKAGIISKSRDAVEVGFLVGTRKLYDHVAKDKQIKMVSTRTINDPMIAGSRPKLMAINSGVAVDLYGQACSEMVPRKGADGTYQPVQYSGTGGQVDFFRAVHRSKGGKGFLTLRSTAKNGTLSTITLNMGDRLVADNSGVRVTGHTPGLVVTTLRNDVDYVVTEWGQAKLRGNDVVERAQALVKIAHPKFRDKLAAEGMARFGGDPAAWQQAAQVSKRELRMAKFFDAADARIAGK